MPPNMASTPAIEDNSLPSPAAFPFMRLPRELQLCIFEYTTLISETREWCWSSETGFSLSRCHQTLDWPPLELRRQKQPRSFFRVSRYFRHLANEVFWTRNKFELYRDWDEVKDRMSWHKLSLEPVTQYPSTEFLTRVVPPEFIAKLRRIRLHDFCYVSCTFNQQAREDWLQCLDQAFHMGLHVQTVAVKGYWSHGPEWWFIGGATEAEIWRIIRDFISELVWPLEEDCPPRGISQHLLVKISAGEMGSAIYMLQRQNGIVYAPYCRLSLGEPAHEQNRTLNFRQEDGTEITWIEGIYFHDIQDC